MILFYIEIIRTIFDQNVVESSKRPLYIIFISVKLVTMFLTILWHCSTVEWLFLKENWWFDISVFKSVFSDILLSRSLFTVSNIIGSKLIGRYEEVLFGCLFGLLVIILFVRSLCYANIKTLLCIIVCKTSAFLVSGILQNWF